MQIPTKQDERQLARVHPDLVKVVRAVFATSPMPFRVLEGARNKEQQRKNIEAGVSWTMKSRHIPGRNGYAHAVDLVPLVNGQVSWDWAVYRRFAPIVRAAAASVGVMVEWGGDWSRTPDAPHWQLPRAPKYAAMSGSVDEPDDVCGAAHPMTDSESGAQGERPPTGPGKWLTAIVGSGGVGSLSGFGYGMEWPSLLIFMLGLITVTCGVLLAIGHERREKLWDRLFG